MMILLMPAAAAGTGNQEGCDFMGIRLYFRNKYHPGEEYCLGKLLHYADYKDKLLCVDFLVSVNALDLYEWYKEVPKFENMGQEFISECAICVYQDYGELFELSTEDLCLFLYLYRQDQKEFWGPDHIVQYDTDLKSEIEYIQKNAAVENRWEFRLGA